MSRLFLGADPVTAKPVTVALERHALTVAGSRTGKGACLIIPNLMGTHAWPDSVLVVDPAGEAAEETAAYRASQLGQEVAILDPFHECRGAEIDRFRTSLNVLDLVETADDLDTIADGLIIRRADDPQPFFNDTAKQMLAGLLAYILEAPSLTEAERNLAALPDVFALIRAGDADTLAEMSACSRFGRRAAKEAARLQQTDAGTRNALGSLETQLQWLASEYMDAWLRLPSAVDLHQLKRGKLSLFVVIPSGRLKEQGQFLRLFVRVAVQVMQTRLPTDERKGTPCLMILDEFYSLGRLDDVKTALAGTAKYALHLWPFLQDWGQLVELYGPHGAQAFFSNADAVCAFGLNDPETAATVSKWLGDISPDDVEPAALWHTALSDRDPLMRERARLLHAGIGKGRFPPDKVMAMLAKGEHDKVAKAMLVFLGNGAKPLFLTPCPYFDAAKPPALRQASQLLRVDLFVIVSAVCIAGLLALDLAGLSVPLLPQIWFGLAALWGLALLLTRARRAPG